MLRDIKSEKDDWSRPCHWWWLWWWLTRMIIMTMIMVLTMMWWCWWCWGTSKGRKTAGLDRAQASADQITIRKSYATDARWWWLGLWWWWLNDGCNDLDYDHGDDDDIEDEVSVMMMYKTDCKEKLCHWWMVASLLHHNSNKTFKN